MPKYGSQDCFATIVTGMRALRIIFCRLLAIEHRFQFQTSKEPLGFVLRSLQAPQERCRLDNWWNGFFEVIPLGVPGSYIIIYK